MHSAPPQADRAGIVARVPAAKVNEAVEQIIQEVGLTEKRDVFSKNLSGGETPIVS
jgi:energy-coupling factor transporter ATP-binding protein EcfA2